MVLKSSLQSGQFRDQWQLPVVCFVERNASFDHTDIATQFFLFWNWVFTASLCCILEVPYKPVSLGGHIDTMGL